MSVFGKKHEICRCFFQKKKKYDNLFLTMIILYENTSNIITIILLHFFLQISLPKSFSKIHSTFRLIKIFLYCGNMHGSGSQRSLEETNFDTKNKNLRPWNILTRRSISYVPNNHKNTYIDVFVKYISINTNWTDGFATSHVFFFFMKRNKHFYTTLKTS